MDNSSTKYLDDIEKLKLYFYNVDNDSNREVYYNLMVKNCYRLTEDILSGTETKESPLLIKTIGKFAYILYNEECKLYALNKIMLFLIEAEKYELCDKLQKLKNSWK